MLLETRRLILRNWRDSDVDSYMTLSRDIGYNCFSPPGHFLVRTPEEARTKIQERITLFNDRKLGKFPVFLKQTAEFIGTCGLGPFNLEDRTEVELGYRLCLAHWGHGYATESATAILHYAFGDLNLEKVFAFALPQNLASLRVLEKLGALYRRDFLHAGLPHRLYQLPRT